MAGTGIVVGLLAAAFLSQSIKVLLFGVSGWDPLTFVVAPLLLGAAAVLAGYVPARRAAAVSPVDALSQS